MVSLLTESDIIVAHPDGQNEVVSSTTVQNVADDPSSTTSVKIVSQSQSTAENRIIAPDVAKLSKAVHTCKLFVQHGPWLSLFPAPCNFPRFPFCFSYVSYSTSRPLGLIAHFSNRVQISTLVQTRVRSFFTSGVNSTFKGIQLVKCYADGLSWICPIAQAGDCKYELIEVDHIPVDTDLPVKQESEEEMDDDKSYESVENAPPVNPLFPITSAMMHGPRYEPRVFYDTPHFTHSNPMDATDLQNMPDSHMVFSIANAKPLEQFIRETEKHPQYYGDVVSAGEIRNMFYVKTRKCGKIDFRFFYGNNPQFYHNEMLIIQLLGDMNNKYLKISLELTANGPQLWLDLSCRITANALTLAIVWDMTPLQRIKREVICMNQLTCSWRLCFKEVSAFRAKLDQLRLEHNLRLPLQIFGYFQERNQNTFLYKEPIPEMWRNGMELYTACEYYNCVKCFHHDQFVLNKTRDGETATRELAADYKDATAAYTKAILAAKDENPHGSYTALRATRLKRKM